MEERDWRAEALTYWTEQVREYGEEAERRMEKKTARSGIARVNFGKRTEQRGNDEENDGSVPGQLSVSARPVAVPSTVRAAALPATRLTLASEGGGTVGLITYNSAGGAAMPSKNNKGGPGRALVPPAADSANNGGPRAQPLPPRRLRPDHTREMQAGRR